MKTPRYSDLDRFPRPYVKSAEQKEGYLARKWDAQRPGWRKPKKKEAPAVVRELKRVGK